jgi:hypothetical protein
MQSSLYHPNRLDLVTFDPSTKEYVLILSANEEWDGSEEEQSLLLQKLDNYSSLVLDGEFAEHFPESVGSPIRIQIDSASALPAKAELLITKTQAALLELGVRLCVNFI